RPPDPQGNHPMTRRFSEVEEATRALQAGRVVIVLDAAERENEGDFLVAAEKATPETLYFMLRHGCGQLCVPVAAEIARRLSLTLMAGPNASLAATPFAVPVDHYICRTVVSPHERVVTTHPLLEPSSLPEASVRPA